MGRGPVDVNTVYKSSAGRVGSTAMSTDLAYLSATEALARFRDRSLSPVELTEALIARAAEVEPTVNALCITYYDEALAQAREAEKRYLGQGAEPRPLEGICVGIKDEMPITGQKCSMGSLRYKDDVAEYTDPVGQRLIDAGAILHARTTAPEFSCAGFTHSRLWGVTRNPWNPEFGVGGSSGGTGASLASGTSTLATGSDIGGSIRIPASWNGVVGFKPPYGRVPQMPPFNLDHYCHTGPLARTVPDCALFENVIAGPHPHDPVAIRPKVELPLTFDDGIEGMKIALCVTPGDWPVDDDVATNTREAAAALVDAGAIVEEIEMGPNWGLANISRLTLIHFGAIFGAWIATELEHRELMTPYAIDMAERSLRAIGETSFYEGLVGEGQLHFELGDIHERYELLIFPTTASRGLVAGDDYVDHGLEVGGEMQSWYMAACMTPPFNICSRSPVLAAPSGFADNGVPTGVQLVARPYDDLTAFRAGAALERTKPWAGRRPMVGASA
jgi:Asp-tRNA(Asn)/Glu-tRNA(Gln) amidotransferase A subunit family amidase